MTELPTPDAMARRMLGEQGVVEALASTDSHYAEMQAAGDRDGATFWALVKLAIRTAHTQSSGKPIDSA